LKNEEKKHRGVYEHPKASGIWWIHFYDGEGGRHREKVGKKSLAIKRYHVRKTEVYEGRFFPLRHGPTFAALKEHLFADYRTNRQNLEPIETAWKRLKPVFGTMRAESLTVEKLNRYIAAQAAAGYANGSINRDMACLKRMLHLATRAGKIRKLPVFPSRLREAAPRSGFVTDEQYLKLADQPMDNWLRALLAMAYKFGFRKQELLSMRVRQLDFTEQLVRLDAGTTKNDEGRVAPMTKEIRDLLERCVRKKSPDDFVFTRDGKPVIDFRGSWDVLTAAAGFPGLLVHDLRRSAVRNMIRRGIPEKVAMAISGHKTRAVFDRYNIVSDTDIREAAARLEDSPTATRTAISVPRGTRRVLAKRFAIK
jgi:integrase